MGRIVVAVCLRYGEVYAVSEKLEGVAAWLPPGRAPFGAWQLLRSVSPATLLEFGRRGAGRLQAYDRLLDGRHRKMITYPHWYLHTLGVDPDYLGRGYSSRLVRPMLERFDRDGLPCFLDTNTAVNVEIYRRWGFELVFDRLVPDTEVHCYGMVRQPKTPDGQAGNGEVISS
jgi:GNAT superfamily N-acetyltransferase